MSRIYFNCVPFDKGDVTLALESGVDGVIVPREHAEQVAGLSRCPVWAAEDTTTMALNVKADEEAVLERLRSGERVVLARGWEVIPVENLLAQSDSVLAEATTLDEARLAAGILERGVAGIVVSRGAVADLKTIVAQCKLAQGREELLPAVVTRVESVGLGHRVCADTLSILHKGQGMGPAPLSVTLGGQKAVSWPYVGLTLQCLTDYGIRFEVQTRQQAGAAWELLPPGAWRELKAALPGCLRVTVHPGAYQAGDYTVEGDWSGASYLLAAGALGLRPVRVEGLRTDSLQGDRAMLEILQRMGARMRLTPDSVTVYPSALHGVELDMGDCPDLVPTVAVLAACAQGSTRISNVAHLRFKESDRISAPAQELAKAGVGIDQLTDGMLVHGLAGRGNGKPAFPRLPQGVALSAHNDHRIAMSLALLGLRQPEVKIRDLLDDPMVVRKSFPQFWNIWEHLA